MKIGENGIILFSVAGLDITTVDKVIFTIKGNGTVTKEYPSSHVTYDNGIFFVGLAQEDTLIISGGKQIRAQAEAQINFKTSQVVKSSTITFMLSTTLNTEIVPGNTPVDDVARLNLEYVNGCILVDGTGRDGQDGTDGASAYDLAVASGFEGTEAEWLASLHGADGTNGTNGTDGVDGTNGASAYEIAVAGGYTGSEAEWLQSLHGTDGTNGTNGTDGKSAYQSALDGGYTGTEEELNSALASVETMTAEEMLVILNGGES